MFSYTGNPPCAVCSYFIEKWGDVRGILIQLMSLAVTSISPPPSTLKCCESNCGRALYRHSRGRTVFSINGGRAPTLSRHTSLLMQHSSSCASRPQPSPPKDRDTEKETAFPVAKHRRFRLKDCIFYRGAASYGLMRPLAGLESMDINNARCYFGRHHRP